MDDILLLCEDSIEGILSGVYEAYSLKKDHNHIHLHLGKIDNYQLFATYREVAVDDGKSARVLKTIWERLGEEAYTGICRAMASEDVNKADSVYHAIVLGLSGNCRGPLMQNLSNEDVQTVFKLSRYVCNEILHVNGFLRFKELETGILFADFGPRNNLLTFIMPHFANRFPNENFAIFDSIRKSMEFIRQERNGIWLKVNRLMKKY